MQTHVEAKPKISKKVHPLLMIVGGTLFLSLASLCRIPLWFTPVPVTLQIFAVLLMGAFLGSRKGPLAVLLYLGCGSCGLPLFSAALGGATTGYLLGFVLAAYLIGLLFEMGAKRQLASVLATFILGVLVVQLCGVLWLGALIGFKAAFLAGCYPFILIDLAKACAATAITAAWLKQS